MLLSITEFLGRFHPLLVHLPIGILLVGIVMHWLSRKPKYQNLRPGITVTLLLGAISAVFSCISGWLLANGGEYDGPVLDQHMWMGIGVAVIAILYYLLYTGKLSLRLPSYLPYLLSLVLVLILSITGHLGGTLTHGEGYLTAAFAEKEKKVEKKIIPDVQQAKAYSDIIQPMLESKCYSCHGTSKQKGKLRLDSENYILTGGEDGAAIVPGKSNESILFQRLMLEETDKKHMPPKGRPQLTSSEIELIHWWISNGAAFDKSVSELEQDEKIKPLLLALQSAGAAAAKPDVPAAPVAAGDAATINSLKEAGATIIPVATGSHYLSVNFISSPVVTTKEIRLLEKLAPQLVWLKISGAPVGDSVAASIAQLTQLTRLSMDRTDISDQGIKELKSLSNLQFLNIVGTKVTKDGLSALQSLPNLQSVYLYQSGITGEDLPALQLLFPGITLDTGGYSLPLLEGDTSEVKP